MLVPVVRAVAGAAPREVDIRALRALPVVRIVAEVRGPAEAADGAAAAPAASASPLAFGRAHGKVHREAREGARRGDEGAREPRCEKQREGARGALKSRIQVTVTRLVSWRYSGAFSPRGRARRPWAEAEEIPRAHLHATAQPSARSIALLKGARGDRAGASLAASPRFDRPSTPGLSGRS